MAATPEGNEYNKKKKRVILLQLTETVRGLQDLGEEIATVLLNLLHLEERARAQKSLGVFLLLLRKGSHFPRVMIFFQSRRLNVVQSDLVVNLQFSGQTRCCCKITLLMWGENL